MKTSILLRLNQLKEQILFMLCFSVGIISLILIVLLVSPLPLHKSGIAPLVPTVPVLFMMVASLGTPPPIHSLIIITSNNTKLYKKIVI
jgi:hypothetical protein